MSDRSHWHERDSHSNFGWKGPKIADGQGGNGQKAQDFRFHKPGAGDCITLGMLFKYSSPEYDGTLVENQSFLND